MVYLVDCEERADKVSGALIQALDFSSSTSMAVVSKLGEGSKRSYFTKEDVGLKRTACMSTRLIKTKLVERRKFQGESEVDNFEEERAFSPRTFSI